LNPAIPDSLPVMYFENNVFTINTVDGTSNQGNVKDDGFGKRFRMSCRTHTDNEYELGSVPFVVTVNNYCRTDASMSKTDITPSSFSYQ